MTKSNAHYRLNGNIIEHLKKLSDDKDSMRHYFYARSKLWKAIYRHITIIDPVKCFIIDRVKEGPIEYHRGTGAGIHFANSHIYLGDNTLFNITFTVEYWDEDNSRSYMKSYSLDIPIELELDFSQEKFDKWTEQKRIENFNQEYEKSKNMLLDFVNKYPEFLKELTQRLEHENKT